MAKGEEKVLSTTEDGVRVSYIPMDSNLKEILKNIEKTNNASKEEVGKLAKEALDSINFVDKIDEINLEFDKYVIFTDGNEQLVYENGEFFVVSTTDVNKKREKKKKEEAKNMYLEYFIRYILNPIIKQRDEELKSKNIASPAVKRAEEKIEPAVEEKSVEVKDKQVKEIDGFNF